MAITVAADVTLREAQDRLESAGQWLALDGDPMRPMGWLMQHDSTGPLRLGYGGWRDLITGVQFTDGLGDLVTAGGITVKNVAGYDLVKFAVGSHGCFGTPVTLTLRTYRRPEAALAATVADRPEAAAKLLESDAPPQWMLWTNQGLRAGWLGSAREMSALLGPLEQSTGAAIMRCRLEEDEAERGRWLRPGIEQLRLHAAPAQMPALLEELQISTFAADPIFGVAWIRMPETFSDVLAAIHKRGGHATWLGRDGVRVYGVAPDAQMTLARLKQHLDPHGKLPGMPFTV